MLRKLIEVRTNLTSAVPTVLPMLDSTDNGVRLWASNALVAIDPVTAQARGVKSNSPASRFQKQ